MKTRFILVQTSHAGNVGAAARAMKVMGFDDLVQRDAQRRVRRVGVGMLMVTSLGRVCVTRAAAAVARSSHSPHDLTASVAVHRDPP